MISCPPRSPSSSFEEFQSRMIFTKTTILTRHKFYYLSPYNYIHLISFNQTYYCMHIWESGRKRMSSLSTTQVSVTVFRMNRTHPMHVRQEDIKHKIDKMAMRNCLLWMFISSYWFPVFFLHSSIITIITVFILYPA